MLNAAGKLVKGPPTGRALMRSASEVHSPNLVRSLHRQKYLKLLIQLISVLGPKMQKYRFALATARELEAPDIGRPYAGH
jgi:hypothetical protein